ncbi:hypothetical protein OG422_27615 [Streptomyces sp. NBC_01525]|uniref:WXG100 family type VII secretion target n=1 Tax=Streptomyces benahoarensis TaxID=2595054 RepID=A0A553ZRX7_9ACTN|nr:hypothetical protein [Streptomyces benahoarensis]TSB32641.1 hypothetical protein FNJ62_00790 [Streptomyces benahoarensis]TSB44197.1 hypothetical protein FNZ23_00085 [Streptomyces benahoarensis]
MGEGFRTDPDAIFRYASHTDRQKEEVPRIGRALEHVEIPSGAFGKLPESDELHTSYNEHATAAQQNIHDLAELLQGVAEGLRATAGSYVQTEYAQQQSFGGQGGGAAG